MATAKTAAKADTKPKAPKAAAAAAPTAQPSADPEAGAPETASADAAKTVAPTGAADPTAGRSVQDALEQAKQPESAQEAPAVHRLERARELVELAKGEPGELAAQGIQSFKDSDGRTMNVVVADNRLYKQEV